MKFIISRLRILRNARRAQFRTWLYFCGQQTGISLFLKTVTRGYVRFGVKRINFSFRSVVKNARAGTVWTVHCASAAGYQRKKSVITCERKKKLSCSAYILDIGIHFLGPLPTAFFCLTFWYLRAGYLDIFFRIH